MKSYSAITVGILLLCLSFLIVSSAQAGVISGREPKTGMNVLNLDNSDGEFDAVAILVEEGWPNPVCSIFIPAGGSYTLDKVPTGSYEIYYMLGKGWNNKKKTFSTLEKMGKIAQPIIMDTTHQTWEDSSYDGLWVNWETNYTIYTFTLYEILGGDIPLEDVDPDDFPKF